MDDASGRASLRISGDYILRWAEMAHHLFMGDHLRALVLNTFLRLNVHHIHATPELNLLYAGLTPPPDDQRRPVTVSEAARAMGMPRVTTGRYVKVLKATGSLVPRERTGFIVPGRELTRDISIAMTDPNYQNLTRMVQRLRTADLLPQPLPTGTLYGRSDRYRLVLRAAGEFVSDWMAAWNRHYPTGYLHGLVFAAILQANDRADSSAAFGLDDDAKNPISANATAASLALPAETVRRHVLRLEADGLLRRFSEGLIVPRSAWDSATGRDILGGAGEAIGRLDAGLTAYEVNCSG